MTAYHALALQTRCRSVTRATDRAEARGLMASSIARLREEITASVRFIGPDCSLVVLPEYALTGHPTGEPPAVWADRAALAPDGPEWDGLSAIAADLGVYLAVNAYELDKHFPGLFFQACVVLDPAGAQILRYRRLNSLMTPTPHDVWDRYLDVYGIDGVFPVARTPIGNLAAIASEEILFPEVARCLAVRGAEVFVHSTSEVGSPLPTAKDVARRARAIENLAYVVSANSAGIEGSPIPSASTDGGSQIVDFRGAVVVEAGPGPSMVANAEIDLDALRRARRRPGMGNLLARNRFELYSRVYGATTVHPANGLDEAAPERAWFADQHLATIQRLSDAGLI